MSVEELRSSIHDSIIFFVVRTGRLKSIICQARPFALRSAQFTQHLRFDKPERKRAKHSRVARELQVVANNIAMPVWYLYPRHQLLSIYFTLPKRLTCIICPLLSGESRSTISPGMPMTLLTDLVCSSIGCLKLTMSPTTTPLPFCTSCSAATSLPSR